MNKPKLYKTLRKALFCADITQEYLAKQLGCCPDTITNMLHNKTPWRLTYCYKVLEMLNVPYTELPKYFPPNGIAQEVA